MDVSWDAVEEKQLLQQFNGKREISPCYGERHQPPPKGGKKKRTGTERSQVSQM